MISPMNCATMLLLSFLLSLTPVESGSEAEIIKALEETQQEVAWKYIPLSGPSIDKTHSKNITAQIGKTAVLNCRIKYLGGKTVSWMRARDLHLLTVGRFTYTSDERFKAVHQTGSDDWLLKIHYAQHRDAGAYECQVSTTPPLSASVYLNVVAEPETQVLGGPDLYINAGSTINLTCIVKHSSDPPPYILWYHQTELLSYDSPRGGITVVTENGEVSSSRLLIQKAKPDDAGQYSCRPADAEPHQINVHIIPNEHPAAIHHKNGTSSCLSVHGRSQTHRCAFVLSLILTFLSLFPNVVLFFGSNRRSRRHSKRKPHRLNEGEDYVEAEGRGISRVHSPPKDSRPQLQLSRRVRLPLEIVEISGTTEFKYCSATAEERVPLLCYGGSHSAVPFLDISSHVSYLSYPFHLLTRLSSIPLHSSVCREEIRFYKASRSDSKLSPCLGHYIPKS